MKIVEIKEITAETADAVIRLCGQLYVSMPCITVESLRRVVESGNSHLIMACDGTEVAGMAAIGIYDAPGGVRAWIEDVVVDGEHRGRGLGRALIEAAVEIARKNGANTLSLTSNPTRTAANELYKSLGFNKYDTNFYKMNL